MALVPACGPTVHSGSGRRDHSSRDQWFQNFVDFGVDLQPLQVIAGPNAGGKSNFFDALQLLSNLAQDELAVAFGRLRGDALDQFTTAVPGKRLRSMKIAVEAVVRKRVRDAWGESAELGQTHLRYTLVLGISEGDRGPRIRIESEDLVGLRQRDSSIQSSPNVSSSFKKRHLKWRPRSSKYIGTEHDRVVLHQDGRQGRKREYSAEETKSTVLSAANSVTFRHAFAMREEHRPQPACCIGSIG